MTGVTPPGFPAGWRLFAYRTLPSTNDEALRLAREGAPEGTVVQALRQEAGRGRYGRRWVSEEGNLYCSTIVRPGCPLSRAAEVGFVAALAAAEAADRAVGSRRAAIKWPNDILVDGAKVAGVLLEVEASPDGAVASALVVGIGVNVIHAPSLPGYPTIALRQVRGDGDVDAGGVLEYLCGALHDGLRRWRSEGFRAVREGWLARCAGLGGPLKVKMPAAEVSGRFIGIDGDGALLLQCEDGLRRIVAGDVLLGCV